MEPGCSTPLAVPFSELNIVVSLPDKKPYPSSLQSIGNHIKSARLTRGILIKDVIAEIHIDRETLRGWELGLFEPHVSHYPKIVNFLGYIPYPNQDETLAEKIKNYRYKYGLTQRGFAELLQTNCSVVWQWESNCRPPIDKTRERILDLINNS